MNIVKWLVLIIRLAFKAIVKIVIAFSILVFLIIALMFMGAMHAKYFPPVVSEKEAIEFAVSETGLKQDSF